VHYGTWNWRMLLATGQSRFADLIEWTLYNAVLGGVSLDGRRYFYVNPLMNRGDHRRQEWFPCACCPPNRSIRKMAATRHSLQVFGGYAQAGIADLEFDSSARRSSGQPRGIARRHRQGAVSRHGLHRVEQEIENRLLRSSRSPQI
jgi:hypothetical protein